MSDLCLFGLWYLSGLIITIASIYKISDRCTLLGILGVLIVSLVGPLTISIIIVYVFEKFGSKTLFRWRD